MILNNFTMWNVKSPELFGDGVMIVSGDEEFYGVIQAWGVFTIRGNFEDCRITPLYSPLIDSKESKCKIIMNDKNTIFRGWVDFRGHPRSFCGALIKENIPEKCKGE
jgi:hypothetical protein